MMLAHVPSKLSIVTLLVLVIAVTPVNAQRVTKLMAWQLPQSLCSGSTACSLWPRLSDDDYLYVLNRETSIVSVFKPDGTPYNQYDLSSFEANQKITIKDFLPFGTDHLIIESPTGSSSLYRYDLRNRTLTAINLEPSIFLYGCGGHDGRYYPEFSRLGPNKLLGCSLEQIDEVGNRTYGIVIIDLETQSVTSIGHFKGQLESPPWASVVGGQDGQIYSVGGIPQGLYDPADLKTQLIITRYDPKTSNWSVIRIPFTTIPDTVDLDLNYVDASSNMYFAAYPIYKNSSQQFQIFKVSSTGQIVWSATESELGFAGITLGVTNDGIPVFWNFTNVSGQDAQITTTA